MWASKVDKEKCLILKDLGLAAPVTYHVPRTWQTQLYPRCPPSLLSVITPPSLTSYRTHDLVFSQPRFPHLYNGIASGPPHLGSPQGFTSSFSPGPDQSKLEWCVSYCSQCSDKIPHKSRLGEERRVCLALREGCLAGAWGRGSHCAHSQETEHGRPVLNSLFFSVRNFSLRVGAARI